MEKYTELLDETGINAIKYCPTCGHDFEEETNFCPGCATNILNRIPEIHVDVEFEGQGSRCLSLVELFDIARERGLTK